MSSLETFHVFCRIRSTTHRIVVMAADRDDAKARAEAKGHDVDRVRKAPTPPIDNLARKGAR